MKLRPVLAVLLGCMIAEAYPASNGETAMSADAFVDSIGVNIHLTYLNTPYANFSMVESSLKNLGVRHVRDGLVDTTWTTYYDRLNTLGQDGIMATLITSPSESAALLADYPQRVASCFEAYEGPNEYDQSGDPNWASTLNAFMARMQAAIASNPSVSKYPIVGPSLTNAASFPQMAASSTDFNYANLHNYFAGRNPGTPGWGSNGYGSYAWNLSLVAQAWPGKPIRTTETGYFNDVNVSGGVPESVSGTYMPRLLLEQYIHGIQRTYIYELVDLNTTQPSSENNYGLVHSDFSPKPAFTAVQSLLHLLSDPGAAFTPGQLSYSLSGNTTDVQHLLFQKRDGTFYLALWIEEPTYNDKTLISVPSRSITLSTATSTVITVHTINAQGQMGSSTMAANLTHSIRVGPQVTVFEISTEQAKPNAPVLHKPTILSNP
jgi:hypothetical protein